MNREEAGLAARTSPAARKAMLEVPAAAIDPIDLEKVRRRWVHARAARHDPNQFERHRGGMPDFDWQRLLDAHSRALG